MNRHPHASRLAISAALAICWMTASGCATRTLSLKNERHLLEPNELVPSPYAEPAEAVAAVPTPVAPSPPAVAKVAPAPVTKPVVVPATVLAPAPIITSPVDDADWEMWAPEPARLPDVIPAAASQPVMAKAKKPQPLPPALAPLPKVDDIAPLTYRVVRGDSLWKIAWKHGITVDELANLNKLNTKDYLRIGQVLTLPPGALFRDRPMPKPRKQVASKTVRAKRSPAPIAKRAALPKSGLHHVAPGESLWKIARHYGIRVRELKEMNGLNTDLIRPGQALLVRANGKTAKASKTTMAKVAKPIGKLPQVSDDVPSEPAKGAAKLPSSRLPHIVDQGDSLKSIAEMYGSRVEWIRQANPNLSPDGKLENGAELNIPIVY